MSKIGETFIIIQVGNFLFFNKKWEIRWGKSGVGSEWVGGMRKLKWEVATTFPPDPGALLWPTLTRELADIHCIILAQVIVQISTTVSNAGFLSDFGPKNS